ncbi:expressed unknown protein [Seminavis robusta]|uniref:Uncharacterized protein n=1 Tax=Seminavis robusta TaxID=568900 RepID=A0A9N8DD93_9STRA|nr:expressed unknown protein [Seminavis robusta]|eukprot:Sro37_g023120.1 n/a (588) ;mRNA; r:32926-35061
MATEITLPPNVTLPSPGFLNGTVTAGGVTDVAGVVSTGVEDGFFSSGIVNASPVFLPEPIRMYERVGATSRFAGVPRFGHTSDFSYVAYYGSGPHAADGDNYVVGLMFAAVFLLVFFLIWTVTLIIFKISLTGFLAGEPFMNPHINDPMSIKAKQDAEEDGEEYIEDETWYNTPRRIRITFFLCGLIQIIFSMLLVTKGVANLQQTTDTIQVSTETLRLYVKDARDVSLKLEKIGESGLFMRDQVVSDLDRDNFCPGNPAFDQTIQGKRILSTADGAVLMLNDLGDFVTNNVATLEEILEDTQQQLDDVDSSVSNVETYEWLGGLVTLPYLILATLMMVATVAAQANSMTDCYLCILDWIVLPLYILVTIFSYVALVVALIGASLNADFCGGKTSSPDQVMLDVMFRLGFKEDGLLFQAVRYYAYQCTERAEVDPFLFLRNFDVAIGRGLTVMQNLTDSIDDVSLLSFGCNRDFDPLHRTLGQMVGVLKALAQAGNQAIKLLRCEKLVPFYTDIVYDATCTYSVTGLAWIFSSLLILSVMGMILIMFRASYQNTIYEKPPGDTLEDENSSIPFHTRGRQTKKGKKRG